MLFDLDPFYVMKINTYTCVYIYIVVLHLPSSMYVLISEKMCITSLPAWRWRNFRNKVNRSVGNRNKKHAWHGMAWSCWMMDERKKKSKLSTSSSSSSSSKWHLCLSDFQLLTHMHASLINPRNNCSPVPKSKSHTHTYIYFVNLKERVWTSYIT